MFDYLITYLVVSVSVKGRTIILAIQFYKKSETTEGKSQFFKLPGTHFGEKIFLNKIIRRLLHKDYATVIILSPS